MQRFKILFTNRVTQICAVLERVILVYPINTLCERGIAILSPFEGKAAGVLYNFSGFRFSDWAIVPPLNIRAGLKTMLHRISVLSDNTKRVQTFQSAPYKYHEA